MIVWYLINCNGRRNAEARLYPRLKVWSVKVDATNFPGSRVQPVEFLRTEVDDECCRWDKTLSWWHQYCAIVSWQVWSLDLSIAVRTVAPEQVPLSVVQFSASHALCYLFKLVYLIFLFIFLCSMRQIYLFSKPETTVKSLSVHIRKKTGMTKIPWDPREGCRLIKCEYK